MRAPPDAALVERFVAALAASKAPADAQREAAKHVQKFVDGLGPVSGRMALTSQFSSQHLNT